MLTQLKSQLASPSAHTYEKFATVEARHASTGETVVTMIDGIEETYNVACEGDVVVTGPKGEEYIVPRAKFEKLYESTAQDGVYKAKGVVKAVKVPTGTPDFTFPAPWGEDMLAQEGDWIVTSITDNFDPEKCYRIEKGAFDLTYRIRT